MRSNTILTFSAACLLAGAEAVKTKQSMWWVDEQGNEMAPSLLEPADGDWWSVSAPMDQPVMEDES